MLYILLFSSIFIWYVLNPYKEDFLLLSESSSFWNVLKKSFFKNIYIVSKSAILGFSIIFVLQLVYNFFIDSLDFFAVLKIESFILTTNKILGELLGLQFFIYVLPILLLLSIFVPVLPILKYYTKLRDIGGRALLILFIVSSFTFFSYSEVSKYEKKWNAQMTEIANYQSSEIQKLQEEIISIDWLHVFIDFTPNKINIVKHLGHTLMAKSSESEIRRFFNSSAIEISKSIPKVPFDKKRVESVFKSTYPDEKYNEFVSNDKSIEKLTDIKKVSYEAIRLSIKELLPKELDFGNKIFIDTLIKSSIETFDVKFSPMLMDSFNKMRIKVKSLDSLIGNMNISSMNEKLNNIVDKFDFEKEKDLKLIKDFPKPPSTNEFSDFQLKMSSPETIIERNMKLEESVNNAQRSGREHIFEKASSRFSDTFYKIFKRLKKI